LFDSAIADRDMAMIRVYLERIPMIANVVWCPIPIRLGQHLGVGQTINALLDDLQEWLYPETAFVEPECRILLNESGQE
jgi:hypothetical protein